MNTNYSKNISIQLLSIILIMVYMILFIFDIFSIIFYYSKTLFSFSEILLFSLFILLLVLIIFLYIKIILSDPGRINNSNQFSYIRLYFDLFHEAIKRAYSINLINDKYKESLNDNDNENMIIKYNIKEYNNEYLNRLVSSYSIPYFIFNKYCEVCQIIKTPYTYHCNICNCCIFNYDHHCMWVRNCIGIFNFKFFTLFILYSLVYYLLYLLFILRFISSDSLYESDVSVLYVLIFISSKTIVSIIFTIKLTFEIKSTYECLTCK